MSVYTSVKHGSEYTTFGHTEPDLLSPVRCRESIRKLDGSSTDVDELRTTLERGVPRALKAHTPNSSPDAIVSHCASSMTVSQLVSVRHVMERVVQIKSRE